MIGPSLPKMIRPVKYAQGESYKAHNNGSVRSPYVSSPTPPSGHADERRLTRRGQHIHTLWRAARQLRID